jgi:hypothetical protein
VIVTRLPFTVQSGHEKERHSSEQLNAWHLFLIDEIGSENYLAYMLITDPKPYIDQLLALDQEVGNAMKSPCARVEFEYQKDVQLSKMTGGIMGKFAGSGIVSEGIVKFLVAKNLVKPGWKSGGLVGVMLMLLQAQGTLERISSSVRSVEANYPRSANLLGDSKLLYHFFKGDGMHKRMDFWEKYGELAQGKFSEFATTHLCVCKNGKWLPKSHKTMPDLYMLPFK